MIKLIIFLLSSTIVLSSCYYINQGYYLITYTYSAKKVDVLLASDSIDTDTKSFLTQVKEIQAFAEALGLRSKKKYKSYKKLDADYLVAVVQAAGELSTEPYKWNYPFMGRLPYKGFYNINAAKKEAKKMKAKGYDVYIRPVSAFSTLNILPDPLFSYMQNYKLYNLVELLIHEQVHASIWIKQHDDFNEQLATFIAKKSMLHYMQKKFGADSDEYQSIEKDNKDNSAFIDIILETKSKLQTMYDDEKLSDAEKLQEKKAILQTQQTFVQSNYDTLFITDGYKSVNITGYNNAFFALISTYESSSDEFQKAFERCDKNIYMFIEQMKLIQTQKAFKQHPYEFLQSLPIR